MGAPKGNKNAKGHDGSKAGRKPLPVEAKALHDAQSLFFEKHDQEELEAKITSGKFSLADRFVLSAMEGDTVILTVAAKKALPDVQKIDHTTKGKELPTPILPLNVSNNNESKEN